jgi:uncharacterized membrane protein
MENQTKKPNNKKFNEALCYMPFWAILIYIIVPQKDKTKELQKHMKYWFVIFIVYLIASFLLSWLMSWLIFIIYLILSLSLWYKVYSWEEVNINIIDDFEKKI